MTNAYTKVFESTVGSIEVKSKAAVIAVLGCNSGIGFYESDNSKENYTKLNEEDKKKENDSKKDDSKSGEHSTPNSSGSSNPNKK